MSFYEGLFKNISWIVRNNNKDIPFFVKLLMFMDYYRARVR